jgi:hypothetical protein
MKVCARSRMLAGALLLIAAAVLLFLGVVGLAAAPARTEQSSSRSHLLFSGRMDAGPYHVGRVGDYALMRR